METERLGINYAVKLGYVKIDESDLAYDKKRNLLFSLYSFRCLFDNAEMTYVNPVLKKYGCVFSIPAESHPLYSKHKAEIDRALNEKTYFLSCGGSAIRDDGRDEIRFDAGSELWQYLTKTGGISGEGAKLPEKLSVYQMMLSLTFLNTADTEFKGLLYIIFSYILLTNAPHEPELYYKLKDALISEEVFEKVLDSKYSINFPDSVREMWAAGYPNILVEWLLPYVEWKNAPSENGATRETEKYKKLLAAGNFSDVFLGTEKLLDSFPDDEDLLLLNIAARISLDTVKSDDERDILFFTTLDILDEALTRPLTKKPFFLYYYGLALIGLKRLDEALDKFEEALEISPSLESARLMKKAVISELEKTHS